MASPLENTFQEENHENEKMAPPLKKDIAEILSPPPFFLPMTDHVDLKKIIINKKIN
jgi:hypothetical protein